MPCKSSKEKEAKEAREAREGGEGGSAACSANVMAKRGVELARSAQDFQQPLTEAMDVVYIYG